MEFMNPTNPAHPGKEMTLETCKEYNRELINNVKAMYRVRYGKELSYAGIYLCSHENPYNELKNVLAQHYNHYQDMAAAQAKADDDLRTIIKLKEEVAMLDRELNDMKRKEDALQELMDVATPDEWRDLLDDVLDDLIQAAQNNCNVSDSMVYVRLLQTFFKRMIG